MEPFEGTLIDPFTGALIDPFKGTLMDPFFSACLQEFGERLKYLFADAVLFAGTQTGGGVRG